MLPRLGTMESSTGGPLHAFAPRSDRRGRAVGPAVRRPTLTCRPSGRSRSSSCGQGVARSAAGCSAGRAAEPRQLARPASAPEPFVVGTMIMKGRPLGAGHVPQGPGLTEPLRAGVLSAPTARAGASCRSTGPGRLRGVGSALRRRRAPRRISRHAVAGRGPRRSRSC